MLANDPAGNSGTDSIVLNLDTIPPQLAVSTLSDGSYTNSETLNISGTVIDAGGLDKLLINGAVGARHWCQTYTLRALGDGALGDVVDSVDLL